MHQRAFAYPVKNWASSSAASLHPEEAIFLSSYSWGIWSFCCPQADIDNVAGALLKCLKDTETLVKSKMDRGEEFSPEEMSHFEALCSNLSKLAHYSGMGQFRRCAISDSTMWLQFAFSYCSIRCVYSIACTAQCKIMMKQMQICSLNTVDTDFQSAQSILRVIMQYSRLWSWSKQHRKALFYNDWYQKCSLQESIQ